jgi:hypothetical protein
MCKTQLVGSLLGIQVNRLLNRSELALGFLVLPKVFMLILVHLKCSWFTETLHHLHIERLC